MPASPASPIPELEAAIRQGSPDRCAEASRRIADLFIDGAERYSDEHILLFDRVLSRLIIVIETKVRAELAQRLAPVRNAPVGVIQRLAGDDDIAVAAPVLTRSPRLDDAALVSIAKTKSQAHLFAISARPAIAEEVTEVLVDCGDRDVARNVAMNRGARFSRSGMAVLADRAANDCVLAEKLEQRPDIPPHVFRSLLLKATDVVRQRLLARARPETRAEIHEVLATVSTDLIDPTDDGAARRTVRALQHAGKLDEAQLVDFAKTGRLKESMAALALICDVPHEIVGRLMGGDQPDATLILCKAAGFAWPTARTVLQGCQRGGSRQKIDEAYGDFERLSQTTAQRLVGFWRACGSEPRQADGTANSGITCGGT